MTNNTIPNVPRDWFDRVHALLYKIAHESTPEGLEAECLGSFIPDILSAPSPAGVGGLEVVGWYTEDHLDDKSATTYSREVADRWLAKGWPVNGIANAAAAQAIIDGLRGEVERLQFSLEVAKTDELSAAVYAETESIKHSLWDAEKERDQQARRICELEGLLSSCLPALSDGGCAALANRIAATMSAGKGSAP